jgi:hypothetical protein
MPATHEQLTPPDKPTILLTQVLGDDRFLRPLLDSQSRANDVVLDVVSESVGGFDTEEILNLTGQILDGICRDDDYWTQDRRDAANAVLKIVDLDEVDQNQLINLYCSKVSQIGRYVDPFGPITSAVEAGQIMVKKFPFGNATEQRLMDAWRPIIEGIESEAERNYVAAQVDKLVGSVPQLEHMFGQPGVQLGRRETPNLSDTVKPLHDAYMDEVDRNGTFKIALWKNTPDFRDIVTQEGLIIEEFWNINNPDDIARSFDNLFEQSEEVKAHFGKFFKKLTGLSLEDTSSDQVKVLADEVVVAARSARDSIYLAGDFSGVIDRLRNVSTSAVDGPVKVQKSILKTVGNFLKEYGYDGEVKSVDELLSLFNDPVIIAFIEAAFRQRNQYKIGIAKRISEIFKLDEKQTDFALASRTRDDMFLGDLTGDCTAYHLNVGMNAWTVPAWLSNPGFNFFKISSEGKLIAKLGVLMGKDENGKTLVVDSMEFSYSITDEAAAINKFHEGLTFLKNWASRVGFKRVVVNRYCNSTEIGNIMEMRLTTPDSPSELVAVGGLSGISELRRNLIGKSIQEEEIHLQSSRYDDWDEMDAGGDADPENPRATLIRGLEVTISRVINKVDTEEADKIQKSARDGNWNELFEYLVKHEFPAIREKLGSKWRDYQEILSRINMSGDGSVEQTLSGDDDLHPLRVALRGVLYAEEEDKFDEAMEENSRHESSSTMEDDYDWLEREDLADSHDYQDDFDSDGDKIAVLHELDEMIDFINMLKHMQVINMTPEDVLKELYGNIATTINLKRRLPVLV